MKNIFFLLAVVMILFSCRKKEFEINNLNGNKITVLGHGGMGIGSIYPMNSLESILNCLNLGADGTEIDVQMTKDGVLIAYHDETFDKSTNLSGKAHTKTWDEIKGTRYTSPIYSNYEVISLDDLFQNISNPDEYIYFFDIKLYDANQNADFFNKFNSALIEIIDKYNLLESVYVEFRNESSIIALQEIRPDIRQFIFNEFEYGLSLAEQYNISGITISLNELSKERVELLHSRGIMIATFNTHSNKRNIEAIEYNVDFIQTDRLKHLIKILKPK